MNEPRKCVALVCTNYTMQSAFGLLILALNSTRLGYETLIYFTFEALQMIRPGGMERLRYLPTGAVAGSAEVERPAAVSALRSELLSRIQPWTWMTAWVYYR